METALRTERVDKLKGELKEHQLKADWKYADFTKACMERSRYYTESFKKTEGEPMVLRRAKAFANYLEKKTIFILDKELIVGFAGKDPFSLPFYCEIQSPERVRNDVLQEHMLTPDEWKEMEGILDYWKGKTLEEQCVANFPDEVKKIVYPPEDWRQVSVGAYVSHWCSPSPDVQMILSTGLNGRLRRINERLAELDPLKVQGTELQETLRKRESLNAMTIATKAVIKFAERYSRLASEIAGKTTDAIRKAELEQIAKNCARVPAEPAETFWEALQAIWFIHMADHMFEAVATGISQRFDQLLLPYFRSDIKAGRLTKETAQELLEHLWIKYERAISVLHEGQRRSWTQGSSMFQNITIGGVDETGNDASNELTYLILDTTKRVRTIQPTISLRYHDKTPDELLAKAWEVIKTGIGMPAFFNDEKCIAHCCSRGISLKDARNYVINGCVSAQIPGTNTWTKEMGSNYFFPVKCLELALNNGVDMLDGRELGPKTGNPREFKTYEDLVEAFRKQMEYSLTAATFAHSVYRLKAAELLCRPFSSVLYKSAIERGEDVTNYEDNYLPVLYNVSGVVDAVDSMASIKKLIFEDRKLTWDKMLKALKADFEGYDDVHRLCMEAPKFGDDAYVDDIARDVYHLVDSELARQKDLRGHEYRSMYHSVSTFMRAGRVTGALPCGRKARVYLADGGISPEHGCGKNITGVLRAASKVDHTTPVRLLLNQRLSPTTTAKQFVDLVRAWGDLGISHIQFNVFDEKKLRDAQVRPEKYPDLIVRVAGYSALFIDLGKDTQESIIKRCEQVLSS